MSSPLGKRRKLNDTSALLKPFRSPLRKPQEIEAEKVLITPPKLQESNGASRQSSPIKTESPKAPSPRKTPAPAPAVDPTLSQDLSTLQRQHAALLTQLSTLRAELDKINQALQIEASPRDERLGKLIKQWRAASQQAAEEIYADVRDRVNGMGGIRAWREREAQRAQKAWGWDDEHEGQRGEEDSEEHEAEDADGDVEKEELAQAQEDESESFSMDMMLRSLNIELDVIGYDREQQKWLE